MQDSILIGFVIAMGFAIIGLAILHKPPDMTPQECIAAGGAYTYDGHNRLLCAIPTPVAPARQP